MAASLMAIHLFVSSTEMKPVPGLFVGTAFGHPFRDLGFVIGNPPVGVRFREKACYRGRQRSGHQQFDSKLAIS